MNFHVSVARGSDGQIERARAKLCSFFLMTVLYLVTQQPIKQLNADFGLPLKKRILIARATLTMQQRVTLVRQQHLAEHT